ncbi:protein mono-ADP-ribosyltransferase PARP4 isoform X2 [Suricata suricatta]|uniref:protein mono-ADP-ribosyltransferase PARP4 isoform X2 n=1 Tax=Suricata suricatta TaxID=37032 RepID=UPI0011554D0F|nr:protein mono-ADP-ribosyltransferase PARP4 isoform X2 [Suricata suricatta]
MTVGIFANCTFCLKVKHLPRQQKKKLQNDIKENGGKLSFLLNPQCTHVILDNADVLSQHQLNSIQKNHVHVMSPDFIWESIKERRLLDVMNYDPSKSLAVTPPPCQKASSSEVTTDDQSLDSSTEKENVVELTESYTENVEIPPFPQDFEVAKYNTLEKAAADGREVAVMELRCSRGPGANAFLISARFRFCSASGVKTRRHFCVKKTSADASEYYQNYIEDLKKQGFLLREYFTPEATQLASENLQALLLEEVIGSSALSREVSDLVEMVWAEALGHLEHTLLKPVDRISLNDVSKAEGVLLLVKTALKNGETDEQLRNMMTEFYRLIPHKGGAAEEVSLRLLAKKEDLCQLIRDMVNVCETNLSKPNLPSLAKYRALRCKIEHVEQNTEEFFRVRKEVLQNNHSEGPVDILQIFRVGRVNEVTEFLSQLGNVKPLLHGSPVQSFVGILSRGLLLPKVVEDRGTKRTDIGNLGSGIYFSDSLSTGVKYSHPGETDGTRLLAVCDVALGKCADLRRRDFSLSEAPPGYDSVHGVRATATVTTDFEDDEFVVYKTNQIKLKYIIKFCIPGDEIKDFHPCNTAELEEYRPEFSKFSKVEDYQLQDAKPFGSIKSGLQDFSGNSVPLEDVHIKGKIIDFVAQVIVFQTYTNQSHVPIEAKYIFPLDDKAAVCGFEAFINGKHIVGEVKEKEAACREYREAISQGHGAYLMDQDAPDVFTVSVGNLPPNAKVLIKITYITELSIHGTRAVFFMPATVAPWQQDRALNENSQDTVEKICVREIGTKQSFSLSMSIEMPYVIKFISSDTHELKQKSTDCKAVISTMDSSSLDSSGFSLHIGLSDAYLPRMWVEKHPEKESEACMLVFQPDLNITLPHLAENNEVIICLDCSTSMEGATFLQAKQVALYALSLVGKKQKINIVKFGTGYKELFSYPKYITNNNVPTDFIMSATPTMGNTDFWKTLRYLSLLYPSQGLRNILLISDGHLQNESLTLHLVKRNVQHTRLFSCGVGSTANHHILRTLSQYGAGVFEYFNSKSKRSWKKQIEDQMTRLHSPSCHSVSIKWQQLSADAPEPLQAPAQVQTLFRNDRLLVYGFVPHCTQATLCALIQEKEFSTMVSTTELQKTTGTMIHKLTARALIRDYEDGILHENETNHEMKKQILKSLIIKLSKENSLITQFTSFVAVEKRDSKESPSPNIPNILELIAKEDVDFLPYMSWQEEQPDPCVAKPLSAFSRWNEELQHQHLTDRKFGSPKLEGFEDLEEDCFSFPLSEKSLSFNFECEDVEKPLDLRQMDSFKQTGTETLSRNAPSLKQGAGSISAPYRLACLKAEPLIGSRFHCPLRLHRLTSASLFGSRQSGPSENDLEGEPLAGPGFCSPPHLPPPQVCTPPASSEQSGPSENDQDRQTDSCSDSSLKPSTPFRPSHLLFRPFAYSNLGASFNFGQVHLPERHQDRKTDSPASSSLELDSPPQPNIFFSPPTVPSSGVSRQFDFHYISGSPFYFQNSPVYSRPSYKPPTDLLFASTKLKASSANVCGMISSSTSSNMHFSEAKNVETPSFLKCHLAKSDITGSGFTASFQAQKDEQNWMSSVPWTKLFSLQTEEGFWKLTPELGFILNLNTNILNSFLEQKGIRSLGIKGRERLLDLIATFLVLQFLRTKLEQKGIVFKSLMKLDDVSISRNIPWAFEEIKKASEWVRRTEGQYPSICQRLELGQDWDSSTKQLLGIQTMDTASPLHRVLNYSQG